MREALQNLEGYAAPGGRRRRGKASRAAEIKELMAKPNDFTMRELRKYLRLGVDFKGTSSIRRTGFSFRFANFRSTLKFGARHSAAASNSRV